MTSWNSGRVARIGLALVMAMGAAITIPAASGQTPQATALGASIIFDRPGTPPIFGANELVEIFTGNISYVGGNQRDAQGQWADVCKLQPGPDASGLPRPTPGLDDFFQPFADVYVVPAGRSYNNNEQLVDLSGSKNTVVGGFAGGIFFEPLGVTFPSGNISAGTYGIVVDECQNGVWDTHEDTYIDNAFQVVLQQDVPPLSFGARQFVGMKERARQMKVHGDTIDKMILAYKVLSLGLDVYKGVTAPSQSVNQMITTGVTWGVAEAAGAVNPYNQLKKRGETIRDQVLAQMKSRVENLAADPPQADFRRFPVPRVAGASFATGSTEFDEAISTYMANIDALSGLSGAMLDAVERYQGADLVGDALWAARLARSIEEIGALAAPVRVALDASATRLIAELDRIATERGEDYFRFRDLIGRSETMFDRLLGSTLETDPDVINHGVDIGGLERSIVQWSDAQRGETSATQLDDPLRWSPAFATATAGAGDFLDSLGDMGTLGTELLVPLAAELGALDQDTVLTIAADGPITAGSVVELSTAGAPAGATLTWDLDGDGNFDDGAGAESMWTVPGDALADTVLFVAVQARQVVDADASDSAVAAFTVETGGNQRPTMMALGTQYRELAPGETTTLTVAASDPDGDPLNYAWFIDGEPVDGATGPTIDWTSPIDRLASELIDVWVSDGSAETRIRFQVHTLGTDADSDGFYGAPGPDCGDELVLQNGPDVFGRLVNPASPERASNGWDDNCNGIVDDDAEDIGFISVQLKNSDPARPIDRTATEGETVVAEPFWGHPFAGTVGEQFDLTFDWGDGTVEVIEHFPGPGVPAPFATHEYEDDATSYPIEVCIEWVTDLGTPKDRECAATSVSPLNDVPLVNAADLRTWGPSQAGPPTVGPLDGEFFALDPAGRSVFSDSNTNAVVAYPAPAESLGPTGYGRFTIVHEVQAFGDDDQIGALFGYDGSFDVDPLAADGAEGEFFDPDADFIGVQWSNDTQNAGIVASTACNDAAPIATPTGLGALTVWRRTGQPLYIEQVGVTTLNVPYDPSDDVADDGGVAQDPGCSDGDGLELLGTSDRSDWPELVTAFPWGLRVANDPLGANRLDPYVVEYDYQPDALTVWVDGVEQLHVDNPDPVGDPFPPGGAALFYSSQYGIRMSATAPMLTFTFDEGMGGEFDPGGTLGAISVPMHDGADDEHVARINWGDDGSTTAGTVTPDLGTGIGWFSITGDHTYQDDGVFAGEVCATDDEGLGTCFPFNAQVANVAPTVDAGSDRVSGATAVVENVTFQDPAALDTHTATIDWGDGTALDTTVVVDGDRGGGIVSGTHIYAASGDFTVEVCVTDDDGGTGCDSFTQSVRSETAAPSVGFVEAASGIEGDVIPLGVGFTDPNVDDTHQVVVDFGDGSASVNARLAASAVACAAVEGSPDPLCGLSGAADVEHRFGNDGVFTVTVEVCDDDDECVEATSEVSIANVAPTLEVDPAGVNGAEATVIGTFSDPGDDQISMSIDWGDGTIESAPAARLAGSGALIQSTSDSFEAAHTYATSGSFNVEVCADDGDGGRTCEAQTIAVAQTAAPTTVPPATTPPTTTPSGGTPPTTTANTSPAGPTRPPAVGPDTEGPLPMTGNSGLDALLASAILLVLAGIVLVLTRRRPRVHVV